MASADAEDTTSGANATDTCQSSHYCLQSWSSRIHVEPRQNAEASSWLRRFGYGAHRCGKKHGGDVGGNGNDRGRPSCTEGSTAQWWPPLVTIFQSAAAAALCRYLQSRLPQILREDQQSVTVVFAEIGRAH